MNSGQLLCERCHLRAPSTACNKEVLYIFDQITEEEKVVSGRGVRGEVGTGGVEAAGGANSDAVGAFAAAPTPPGGSEVEVEAEKVPNSDADGAFAPAPLPKEKVGANVVEAAGAPAPKARSIIFDRGGAVKDCVPKGVNLRLCAIRNWSH